MPVHERLGWSAAPWEVYDDFGGAALDLSRWEYRTARNARGEDVSLLDPTAVERVDGGVRQVRIDRFTRRASDVQNLDNPKHLTVSTRTFEVPDAGWASFGVEMSATKLGGNDDDYRDGFATFNVIDVEHRLVVDVIATGARIHALYERQERPVGFVGPDESFLYIVDNPELTFRTTPGQWHDYEVTIERPRRAISVFVDGERLFRTESLPVLPRLIKLGMGILTLSPLRDGESTSLRGQGMAARWRNVKVRTGQGAADGAERRRR